MKGRYRFGQLSENWNKKYCFSCFVHCIYPDDLIFHCGSTNGGLLRTEGFWADALAIVEQAEKEWLRDFLSSASNLTGTYKTDMFSIERSSQWKLEIHVMRKGIEEEASAADLRRQQTR
jgi:hypothetical protein